MSGRETAEAIERLRGLGIEYGPNGLTREGIESLRAYVQEHGDAPPALEELTVDRTHKILAAAWSPADDDPPVQCWHTEPDTTCDWNICRQPERLAAGDYGTDPAETPKLGPKFRELAAREDR